MSLRQKSRKKVRPDDFTVSPEEVSASSLRSWQVPPDGLFDVIVPKLTAKQFVVVQLVCREWSHAARSCLKDATPKRPDVDLSKLVASYPNINQLNLSYVEGLSVRMLAPLRQLTALRELCLSNITLQRPYTAVDAPGPDTAAGCADQAEEPVARPHTRARVRAGALSGKLARDGYAEGLPPKAQSKAPSSKTPGTSTHAEGAACAGQPTSGVTSPARGGPGAARDAPSPQCEVAAEAATLDDAACEQVPDAVPDDAGVAGTNAHGAGGSGASGAAAGAGPVPSDGEGSAAAVPALRVFGELGDVLLRLHKLQAELCPALSAEALRCLPRLTELSVDSLASPEALATPAPPHNGPGGAAETGPGGGVCGAGGRLRCLAIKKLAAADALHRLAGLTCLTVNSDSACASDFLPAAARLPELRSLTFKTSSTKVLQPDLACWPEFSRLTSLDLRAPVECLRPGLPTLAELPSLASLALDLYCAGEEELNATVVAPRGLTSLFVSADRSRSGGVIDVHPNAGLRCLRIRLYWTALNLVLPEGLAEPSPLPEPGSGDLAVWGPRQAGQAAAAQEQPQGQQAATAIPFGSGGTRMCVRGAWQGRSPRAAAAAGGRGVGRQRGGLAAEAEAGSGEEEEAEETGEEVQGPAPGRRKGSAGAAAAEAGTEGAAGSGDTAADDADSGRPPHAAAAVVAGGDGGGGAAPTAAAAGASTPIRGRCHAGPSAAAAATGGAASPAPTSLPAASLPDTYHASVTTPAAAAGASGGAAAADPAACTPCRQGPSGLSEPALTELCLDACFLLLYGSLVPLLGQFPGLARLQLDNCLALENTELAQLCCLASLTDVSLGGLHLASDAGLVALGRLPRLACLRVKGLRKLSVHAAQAYVRQRPITRRHEDVTCSFLTALAPLSRLRSLTLKHLHTASEAALGEGLAALTRLTRLKVKDVHAMSDCVLGALGAHTSLRELSVLHCEGVTLKGRTAVVRALGLRVALDFEGCSLPDLTRPACAQPTTSTQAQLIGDDAASSSNHPRRSCQHSNGH